MARLSFLTTPPSTVNVPASSLKSVWVLPSTDLVPLPLAASSRTLPWRAKRPRFTPLYAPSRTVKAPPPLRVFIRFPSAPLAVNRALKVRAALELGLTAEVREQGLD